jgi:hypothetical protein
MEYESLVSPTTPRNQSRRNSHRQHWIKIAFLCLCAYQFFASNILLIDPQSSSKISSKNDLDTGARPNRMDQLLIPSSELGRMDYFSDSWLLNKANFLKIDAEHIEMVEDACFQVIDRDVEMNKMFVDWTYLSVEHLSKWWKSLQVLVHPNPGMFQRIIEIFQEYLRTVSRSTKKGSAPPSPLHHTVAMIAFQSYDSTKFGPERGHQLTAYTLAATIASLYQVGFGRIVVTGYHHPSDEDRVREAFQIVDATFNEEQSNLDETMALQVGHTDLVYVRLQESWVKTQHVPLNVPRGALIGMQMAITEKLGERHTREWLGDVSKIDHWKYFYLTEPDTILSTKPLILPLIRDGLDKGWIFFPHRLQPIPHEADLPVDHSFMSPGRYVPSTVPAFSNITLLRNPWDEEYGNNNTVVDRPSHCCDMGKFKPGRSEEFGTKQRPCGKWWWACGFTEEESNLSEMEVLKLHKRLVPYPMMRLQGGTGVVVAATEMGRSCHPSTTPCTQSSDRN